LGFELRAVGATATAGLGELVAGVHVSMIFCVDTMLLDWRRHCQMGWPDAYVSWSVLSEKEQRKKLPKGPAIGRSRAADWHLLRSSETA
jgi:hypothetical protein